MRPVIVWGLRLPFSVFAVLVLRGIYKNCNGENLFSGIGGVSLCWAGCFVARSFKQPLSINDKARIITRFNISSIIAIAGIAIGRSIQIRQLS